MPFQIRRIDSTVTDNNNRTPNTDRRPLESGRSTRLWLNDSTSWKNNVVIDANESSPQLTHTQREILSWSSYHTRNSFCYKSPRQISPLVIWYVEVEGNLFHRSILPSERWRPLSLFWLSSVFNKARYVAALCREARVRKTKDVFWRNDAKFGFMKVKSLSLRFLTIDVDLRKAKVLFEEKNIIFLKIWRVY